MIKPQAANLDNGTPHNLAPYGLRCRSAAPPLFDADSSVECSSSESCIGFLNYPNDGSPTDLNFYGELSSRHPNILFVYVLVPWSGVPILQS